MVSEEERTIITSKINELKLQSTAIARFILGEIDAGKHGMKAIELLKELVGDNEIMGNVINSVKPKVKNYRDLDSLL